MKYLTKIYLLLAGVMVVMAHACSARISSDSTVVANNKTEATKTKLFNTQAKEIKFEYQIHKGSNENTLMLHLKDKASLVAVHAYDNFGNSKLVLKKYALNEGFYSFELPIRAGEAIRHWELQLEGQRVVSFIK